MERGEITEFFVKGGNMLCDVGKSARFWFVPRIGLPTFLTCPPKIGQHFSWGEGTSIATFYPFTGNGPPPSYGTCA